MPGGNAGLSDLYPPCVSCIERAHPGRREDRLDDTSLWNPFAGRLAAGGEQSAIAAAEDFAAFFEHTHGIVFRYVYGLGGGPQETAEDLTAEAFTRAWRSRGGFRGDEGAALGWLLQIARNLVIDEARRRSLRPETPIGESSVLASTDPAAEDAAMAREDRQILVRLLQSLPEESRDMLVLRYLVGWRVNQIAEHLGMHENSVSVGIRRALERVQRQWPAG
jgi:RNA polymerase sigma-70 factor (ECF subfamily)